MKLHAQNQLYTSFSFSDLKVSIASLGMSDPTYFNRYAPPCKKSTLYHKWFFLKRAFLTESQRSL